MLCIQNGSNEFVVHMCGTVSDVCEFVVNVSELVVSLCGCVVKVATVR